METLVEPRAPGRAASPAEDVAEPPPFFRRNVLFHTHVEKTAGTTLVKGLKASLGAARVHDLRERDRPYPQDLSPEERGRLWVLTGHFNFDRLDRWFARDPLYLACVRSPFERFKSYVKYVGPSHPAYPSIVGRSFPQIIEEYIAAEKPAVSNPLAQKLSGPGRLSLKRALRNIEERYLLVIPHHDVNRGLDAVIRAVGGRTLESPLHENRGADDELEDAGAQEDAFNTLNAMDWEIYNHVLERYPTWIGEMEDRVDRMRRRRRRSVRFWAGRARRGLRPQPLERPS